MSVVVRARPSADARGCDVGLRRARARSYLMCPPEHFDVAYAINPWMDPSVPVDRARAMRQWHDLVDTHRGLGHRVDLLPAVPGLPDMVFTANGALVVDGRAHVARFTHPERRAEADHHLAWLRSNFDPTAQQSVATSEAEGDLLVVGDLVLAGTGFRTDRATHDEVEALFRREVVTLELVDPSYYHLDVALAVLDDATVAWYPPAFSVTSQAVVAERFPGALEVTGADAAVLGCNVVGDGRHVVLDHRAETLADDLADAGFVPVPVEVDEFTKAGGGVKCMTMELRPGILPTSAEPTTTSDTTRPGGPA